MKRAIALLFALILTCGVLPPSGGQTPQEKKEDKKEDKVGRPDDVPVVKPVPKAKVKEEDSPPSDGEQAILPINLVKNRVSTLKVGTVGYVSTASLKADSGRKCWLLLNALTTGTKSVDRPVQVKRDVNGYHILLESVEHQWLAEDMETTNGWTPIRTITVK